MRTLSEIVAQIGRGVAYPMRFSDGGVVENMSAVPTLEEAKLAARGAIRAVARVGLGEVPFNRDEGTLLRELRGQEATQPRFDAATASVSAAVTRNVDFVEGAAVERTEPPVTGIFDGSSFRVTAHYAFARTAGEGVQQSDAFDLVAGADRG